MATDICKFCHAFPAKHLDPVASGPAFGLPLEDGSDDYCCYECWEACIHVASKMTEDD
jgi:hypothetical protein